MGIMNEYRYDDIEVGKKESFSVTITNEMMYIFSTITGDLNSLHQDSRFAISSGFNSRVVYGMLTSSFLSTLAGMYLPGRYSIIHELSVKLPAPVYVGDRLLIEGQVKSKNDTFRFIELRVSMTNQNKVKVLRGSMRIGLLE